MWCRAVIPEYIICQPSHIWTEVWGCLGSVLSSGVEQFPLLLGEAAARMCQSLLRRVSLRNITERGTKHTECTSIPAAPCLAACCCSFHSCSLQSLSEGFCSYLGGGEFQPVSYTTCSSWQWVFLRRHVESFLRVERNFLLPRVFGVGKSASLCTAEIAANFAVHGPCCCGRCSANYAIENPPSHAAPASVISLEDTSWQRQDVLCSWFCQFASLHAPLRPSLGSQCMQVTAQTWAFSNPYLSRFKNRLFGK